MADSESRAEVGLALLAIVLSGMFLVEGAKLKPGVFEPIGPGAVPMGVAMLTLLLSALVLLGNWRRRASGRADAGAVADAQGVAMPEQWRLLLAVGVWTLVYTAVLQAGVVRYGIVTVVYLLAMFLMVSTQPRKDIPWSVGLALVFGLGLDFVFRHLLVADLP